MATTQGFELVAEVQQSFILQVVQAAYDSSKIPHSTPVPAGTMSGLPGLAGHGEHPADRTGRKYGTGAELGSACAGQYRDSG